MARGAQHESQHGSQHDDDRVDPSAALASALVERLVARRDAGPDSDAAAAAERAVVVAHADFSDHLRGDSEIAILANRARLSLAEAETLAVAAGVEREDRLQLLLAHVHADRDRTRLELGTMRALFGDDERAVLAVGPASGLRRAALITVSTMSPWSRQVVSIEPTVMWALAGDPEPDPDLPHGASVHDLAAFEPGGAAAVLAIGSDRIRRRAAGASAATAGRFLVVAAPTDARGWAAVVREATLAGTGVMVEFEGALPPEGREWIDRARHLDWVLATQHSLRLDELPDLPWIEVVAPAAEPTDEEWLAALGTLERRHALSAQQLDLVVRTLPVVGGDLDAAVRRLVSTRLEELARRIRPSRTWADLVLPPGHTRQLRELIDRYHLADRVYGDWNFPAVPSRGLVALFSGPSGTGKTLAAEVIAGELGLDMFKLNLSSVVSKYIGETEKNLDELFEAAGAGNMVLFFDEADALFGRRSEVKDAHDKYANLETSYLLQRLESYDGVVVMATNFEKNIDDAFLRRIHTRVDFAVPGPVERAQIWRNHLQHGAPLDADVDIDDLARRFDLAGGAIRNASVHAAFLAAAEAGSITQERLVRGMAREYRKLGRLLNKDDFGPYWQTVSTELQRG
jgi:AAA+ superfamily predicted ATPase